MDAETVQRPETRDRLPTRQMISGINDVEALEAIRDDVDRSIKQIEVDLEFDVERDEGWAHRARSALAAHNICMGNLNRRLHLLRNGKGRNQDESQAASLALKTEKRLAHELKLKEQAENKDVRLEGQRQKTKRMGIEYASRQSWLARFYRKAVKMLTEEQMQQLCEAVDASLQQTAQSEA